MNKQKASPMSEATLWRLYRRLLGEHLFTQRLPARRSSRETAGSSGIAAALSENLLEGDTLGLAPDDLATRYLCGVPLTELREAAIPLRGGKRKNAGWALPADATHGLLPSWGEEQASLAVGTALAARLHPSGSLTILMDKSDPARSRSAASRASLEAWAHAAQTAASLQLPLLFITAAPPPVLSGPTRISGRDARRNPPALPAIPVDRMDALALYRVIYESAARARSGGGPTWIECSSWPLVEVREGEACETALAVMEQALRARKLFDRQQQRHLQQSIEKEFAAAGWMLRRPS